MYTINAAEPVQSPSNVEFNTIPSNREQVYRSLDPDDDRFPDYISEYSSYQYWPRIDCPSQAFISFLTLRSFSNSAHRFIVILLLSNSPSYSSPAFLVFSPAVFRVSPQLKSSNFQ